MPRKTCVGIIAEDESDVLVIVTLLRRLTKNTRFSWERFVGDGCAKVRSKLTVWSNILHIKGCTCMIVVHDLDRCEHAALNAELTHKASQCKIDARLIVIPTEELEAWLLSDMLAIKSVFNLKKTPKEITNPQLVKSPKEHLRNLVKKSSMEEKDYLNTRHNNKIAQVIALDKIANKCSSFRPLRQFASVHF